MRLAIVIPTLDEEEALRRNLPPALREADEVVVTDGGSRDGTVEVARGLGATVATGPPGRGGQLNRGAAATTADHLLFLHADTVLPPGGGHAVRAALAGGASGGAFHLRFDVQPPVLRLGAALINARTRLTHLPLGDQAQFVTRAAFTALGGFREWPILEDLDFAWRLRRLSRLSHPSRVGRPVLLPGAVTTGARRFLAQGPVRTVATNWLIWSLFVAGVSPQRLARLYRHIR